MSSGQKKKGKLVWLSPDAFLRNKIRMVYVNLKKRSIAENIECNVTVDYLISIFPKDYICSASGVLMQWGNNTPRDLSPSLDKIFPKLGYTQDNVVWVSNLVNRIKNNADPELLLTISNFYSRYLLK